MALADLISANLVNGVCGLLLRNLHMVRPADKINNACLLSHADREHPFAWGENGLFRAQAPCLAIASEFYTLWILPYPVQQFKTPISAGNFRPL